MVKHYNIPIFVPHEGCPHDCVFCNQRKITGLDAVLDLDKMRCLIEDHLRELLTKQHQKHIEIAFFGGSFTGIPVSHQRMYLSLAYEYKKAGLIDGIRLSTRPDYIDREILSLLKEYGVTTVELGVQSLNEKVLVKSKRGHTAQVVKEACELIKSNEMSLGLQMMIGLPGDTDVRAIKTAEVIISNAPDFVRIYPTLIIKDTELEVLYKDHVYKPLSLNDAVNLSAILYEMFVSSHIPVIRLGLQPTDELSGGAVVAGPYHPAFRQLVMSQLYKKKLEKVFATYQEIDEITIYISAQELSNLVGQKRVNLIDLESRFNIKKIKVFEKKFHQKEFEVVIDGRHIIIKN